MWFIKIYSINKDIHYKYIDVVVKRKKCDLLVNKYSFEIISDSI